MTPDDIQAELDDIPAKAKKVLDSAFEQGWKDNGVSLVVRLDREDAVPFFARWDLIETQKEGEETKRSWRFQGARTMTGQALNFNDILLYLADPAIAEHDPEDCGVRGCRKETEQYADAWYCVPHAKSMGAVKND